MLGALDSENVCFRWTEKFEEKEEKNSGLRLVAAKTHVVDVSDPMEISAYCFAPCHIIFSIEQNLR